MVRLSRITTKTGDGGQTALSDGVMRTKSHPRVVAIGEVDEANCALGIARLHSQAVPELDTLLQRLQNDLFDVGADLATPHAPKEWTPIRIVANHIAYVEAKIAEINARLLPLNSFVLPAGTALAAHLHMARAVVRRAERAIVALSALPDESVSNRVIIYMNRLSDLLFILARDANDHGRDDVLWVAGSGGADAAS
jgi:cob(I)alamin adenosyltransferase